MTFIARRIMICAAEDVGMADPNALTVAVSASLAVERVGMPESQLILAEAVTYIATAPKSNATTEAIFAATGCVKEKGDLPVPPHLQDAHYKSSAKLGRGTGYLYAHDYPMHYVNQQYLPDAIQNETFFHPGENGYEKQVRAYLDLIQKRKQEEQ